MAKRANPMGESMVAFDQLGAGIGQLVAISEGREACAPFWPDDILIDAYCAAILDTVDVTVDINGKPIKPTK
jgi:microcompartment protein CcmK/EutM